MHSMMSDTMKNKAFELYHIVTYYDFVQACAICFVIVAYLN